MKPKKLPLYIDSDELNTRASFQLVTLPIVRTHTPGRGSP